MATLGVWQATIVDNAGNVQAAAQITVQRELPGLPPAACFSAKDGSGALGSSFLADGDGYVRFYAAGGFYRITATLGAFSRAWRDVPIGTGAGTDSNALPVAVPPTWLFDPATTDVDPGDGEFRLNNADPALATAAYIDNLSSGGPDVSAWLDTIDDSGNTGIRGLLTIFDPNNPATVFRHYVVSGSVVDGTGYRKLTLTAVSGAGSFATGTAYQMTFAARGPTGDVSGPDGGVVDGQFAVFFGSPAGGQIEGAETPGSPPAPVVLAEDQDVPAATEGALIHAGHLESASSPVVLADNAPIALDWASGINFEVTLTTDRVLGNPTNGQPGTWRTVLVKSDGGPDDLTFGSQYGGQLPSVLDVTTTQFYFLMIYCKSASQFLVTAMDGSDA